MLDLGAALSAGANLVAIYGLVGLGFVIIYRASGVLNFAHGAMFALGGYIGFALCEATGMPMIAACPLVALIGGAIGWLFYRGVMPTLAGQPHWVPVLVTCACGFFILAGVIELVWTPASRDFLGELGFANTIIRLPLEIDLSTIQAALLVGLIVVELTILALYRYARIGIQMKAAAHDHHLASFRGIDIHAVFALAWSIATAIAMLAGFAYSVDQRLDLHLVVIAIKAFPAAMVGGLEAIGGLILGALIVGMSEAFATVYIDPQIGELVPFALLLLILFTRPWGLFGRPQGALRV